MTNRPWNNASSGNAALCEIDETTYFGEYDQYMTAHKTEDFRRSPATFYAKHVAKTLSDPERPAYAFGSAAHCFILEGFEAFRQRFVVADGPINGKTGKTFGRATKAFAEWLDELNADGVDAITVEEFEQIEQMRANVFDHETAAKLFAAGLPEQTIRGELAGVPCQSRFDWLCEKRNVIVDLKTCQALNKFERDFDFFGYARQMAFYALIRAEMTDTNPAVYVVAVEKQAPFACGVWFVTPSTIATASDDVLATLLEFKKCERSNVWPTRFESLRQI